jgi:hypothetical protein
MQHWASTCGLLLYLPASLAAATPPPGPVQVELVCVDSKATGYATFQSYNQKVVSNRHGIFLTHIRSRNEAYTAQQWRLSRSTDGGKTISLRDLSGLFSTRSEVPGSPLFCVSQDNGRIACLVSCDNGQTWQDHAISPRKFNPYSVGGCREVTTDGHIIGSFTDQIAHTADTKGNCPVYFFRIAVKGSSTAP